MQRLPHRLPSRRLALTRTDILAVMTAADKYIALLRGINVGKAKRIAMAELRDLLTELGYDNVQTLLVSGNAVFTATRAKPEGVERRIKNAIAERFGFDVSVIVRSGKELAKVVANNPFPEHVSDGSKLHVSFLSDKPTPAALRGIDLAAFAPEEVVVAGRELYLWLARGVAESNMLKVLSDKRLGVAATARNWNTVAKLLAMIDT